MFSCALLAPLTPVAGAVETTPTTTPTDGNEFFESRIRPLLVEHCYKCHSGEAEKLKGGLLLDTRDGIRKGGESGSAAVVPGEPQHSKLIEAVSWINPDLKMPPKTKLSDRQIADLTTWIKMGAPDPREASSGAKSASGGSGLKKPTKDFWSFKKPVMPPIPNVKESNWARNEVDRFVLA